LKLLLQFGANPNLEGENEYLPLFRCCMFGEK